MSYSTDVHLTPPYLLFIAYLGAYMAHVDDNSFQYHITCYDEYVCVS